jgi:hypothetical protein
MVILQGLSAETLARLITLAGHGEDYSGILAGPGPARDAGPETGDPPEDAPAPAFKLAAE